MAREGSHAAQRRSNLPGRGGHRQVNRGQFQHASRAQATYRQRYHRDGVGVRSIPQDLRPINRMVFEGIRGTQRATSIQGSLANPSASNASATRISQGTVNLNNTTNTNEQSLFYTQDSQPSQAQAASVLPSSTPARNVVSTKPIRMFNKPKAASNHKRNTYKGKNPTKKGISNNKLRAVFAGRPYPHTTKKFDGPVLRMGLRDNDMNGLRMAARNEPD